MRERDKIINKRHERRAEEWQRESHTTMNFELKNISRNQNSRVKWLPLWSAAFVSTATQLFHFDWKTAIKTISVAIRRLNRPQSECTREDVGCIRMKNDDLQDDLTLNFIWWKRTTTTKIEILTWRLCDENTIAFTVRAKVSKGEINCDFSSLSFTLTLARLGHSWPWSTPNYIYIDWRNRTANQSDSSRAHLTQGNF